MVRRAEHRRRGSDGAGGHGYLRTFTANKQRRVWPAAGIQVLGQPVCNQEQTLRVVRANHFPTLDRFSRTLAAVPDSDAIEYSADDSSVDAHRHHHWALG